MTFTPFFHGTFTLRRTWNVPARRVFEAWADPRVKAQWFTGPRERWTLSRREMDFRVGGREVLEGRFNESGMVSCFDARYHVIEPDSRLVYAYDLFHSGRLHSVTLSSLALEPAGEATRVAYTEQIVFMDGSDGVESRRHGTGLQFDLIEKILQPDGAQP